MDQVYGTAGNVKKKTHLTRGLPKPDTQIEVEMRDQEPVMNGRREASMMSTEHFKAIIDCIGDPIFVKDRRYRYVFMNDAACEMFGIPREPSLGKTDYELFPKGHADVIRKHDSCVFETGEEHVDEEQITDAQGSVRTIVTKKTLYINEAGEKHIVGAIRDVTERKRAEEALRDSETTLRSLINATRETLLLIDPEGKILVANETIAQRLGRSVRELTGTSLYEYFPPDVAARRKEEYDEVVRTGQPVRFLDERDERVYESYAYPVFNHEGQVAKVAIFAADITENRWAEEQLRQKTALLEAQVNASLDGIIVVDKGRKILQNQQANELLKLPGHITGSDDAEAQIEWVKGLAKDPEGFYEKVTHVIANPGETMRDELEFKDGTVLDRYTRPVIGKDGKHYGRIWTFRDITERKRSEAALRASRLQLSEAMDLALIVYWEFDPAAQAFVFNDPFYAFYGTTAEREGGYLMTREDYAERFMHPDDLPRYYQFVEQGGSKPGPESVSDMEHRIIRRDGEVRHILARVRVLKDGSGRVVKRYGANQDITEWKRAEEELQKAHRRLSDIIDLLPDATFVVDREKRVVAWNKAIEEMTGVKKEEILGKGDYAYAVPFYGKPRPIDIDLVFERDEEIERTYDHVQRDGSKLSIEVHVPKVYGGRGAHLSATASPLFDREGNIVGAIESIRDTTEQKRIEKALQESEERYRTAIESSNDGVALVREGRHIYVNRKFLDIFGYRSLEEVVGKTHHLTVHPDDLERVVSYNRRRQRGEAVPDRYEFKGLRKNGDIIYIEASVTGTTYQGEPISLAFIRDVTERKSLEAQLRQAQKMEAIGTLAGGVAHDFNNILMVLMGYANLLQMKMDRCDPLRVYVDQILASTAKAANITQSLLAFGRKQVLEMKPYKITTIVEDVEKLLQRLMPEDIELTIELGDDATVTADLTQVEQLLMNLATNARDAMPRGGKLGIKTQRVKIGEEFRRTYGFGKPGPYVLLSVSDTGIGMDKKTQEKVFEPFFTTKEPGKGTGLGLSIVYGIIKQHNGYINVSSRPGEGSTFLLYLPEVKERPRETRSAVREAKGGRETLLLAEDNADIRAVTSDILKVLGYTVIEAVNGRDAVEKFGEHRDEIKLVILDVVMPEKNGKEAYEEIRSVRHDVKALFMSGYTGDIVLGKGVFGKTLDYISKPIAPNDLLQKVRNILDR